MLYEVITLLLGQLRTQEGDVLINGQPIDDIDLDSWRERVAWMNQHPRLMAGTLAVNLRVARSDASETELVEALDFAGLGTWFASLSDGLVITSYSIHYTKLYEVTLDR